MKYLYFLCSVMFITLFSNCAGNKNLADQPPAQIQQAYTVPGENSLLLYIPVSTIQEERIGLKSVYFRGMIADLQQDSEKPGLYVAKFNTGKGNYKMHSDPKKEYGNRPPQPVAKAPVEIEDNEAVLVFTENDKEKFYKITGIEERSRE